MLISNDSKSLRGIYSNDKMWTSLLIGELNSGSKEVSIQLTYVEIGGCQGLHSHPEDQCYYIIEGSGIMHVNSEEKIVNKGDAIFIKGNMIHGIKNNGNSQLSYLTANKAFGCERENQIWKD
jgi:quercetin dioxygenase-like cupin family protein